MEDRMNDRQAARELASVARMVARTAALVPDEWMDVLMDGAKLFVKKAKRRGYLPEAPSRFIGGARFDLGSAGGKDGVDVTVSLFKPVNEAWFVKVVGWVEGQPFSKRAIVGQDLPDAEEVSGVIEKLGRGTYWRR